MGVSPTDDRFAASYCTLLHYPGIGFGNRTRPWILHWSTVLMLTSSLLGIGWPPAAPHQSWDRPCCGSATRRLRRPRRIGVIGTGLDSRRVLRIAATGMHDYSWRVAFVLSVARRLRRNRGSRQRSVPLGGSVAFGEIGVAGASEGDW